MPGRPRAAVLIDNGYLVKVLESDFRGLRIDYQAFSDKVCEDNEADRQATYVYDGAPYQDPTFTSRERQNYANRMRFFTSLRKLKGFEVKLGKQVPYYDEAARKVRFKQKGVDVKLAVDMVVLALDPAVKVDAIVLVAGDADFVPAVDYVTSTGVEVILYHSFGRRSDGRKSYADALRSACSKSLPLNYEVISARSIDGPDRVAEIIPGREPAPL